jgi:quercetin dioxygenase-like cupin family protein
VSRTGQTEPAPIVVGRFELATGQRFEWHEHPVHQLAWAPRGVLAVRTGRGTFVLPATLALWLPAGVGHATGAAGPLDMCGVYFRPERCALHCECRRSSRCRRRCARSSSS